MHDADDTIQFLKHKIEQHQKLMRLYRAALFAELALRGDDANDALITDRAAPSDASTSMTQRTPAALTPAEPTASGEATSTRVQIIEWLQRAGRPARAGEIASALGLKRTTTSSELVRAEEAGQLRRVARGLYTLR